MQVAAQPVGFAGAALIDEQQIAFHQHGCEQLCIETRGDDCFLAGSAHENGDGIRP